jgi:hypothetical protein
MSLADDLRAALEPVLATVTTIDPSAPDARARLEAALPIGSPAIAAVRSALRAAVEAREVADREANGVRFSRLAKAATPEAWSVDVVHMTGPGPGHTHPNGEIDLCFAVSGAPQFDGADEGWTAYPAGSWHVPTVAGGAMDILYFLPGGAIRFEPKPG